VTLCLDAWAVLAWLDGDEPAISSVERALGERPYLSWINAIEVYYRIERDHGRDAADEVLSGVRSTMTLDLPGTARMVEVARLKARARIALGDCFAIATAAAHNAQLLTGDPEILGLDDCPCALRDLRS
jgi:uncharacterized protein with PIN domain